MFKVKLALPILFSALLLVVNCTLLEDLIEDPDNPPTKSRMEGLWQVVEAYDEDGDTITSNINFPVTAFHFSSDNGLISTAGPMITQIVYGSSNYSRVASMIDQFFNYANLSFTGGEWFIEGGVVNRFTLEMKLEGLPGQNSFEELLELFGIGNDYLRMVIYHRFMDVSVTFDPVDEDIMYWDFDLETTAVYNTKNQYGDNVLWEGVPAQNFSRNSFVLQKRSKTLAELVEMNLE